MMIVISSLKHAIKRRNSDKVPDNKSIHFAYGFEFLIAHTRCCTPWQFLICPSFIITGQLNDVHEVQRIFGKTEFRFYKRLFV